MTKEPKTSRKQAMDINERQIFNIKSVETACSTVDIKTTKCKYCEIRSKSQEELTKITKTQEIIKTKDTGKGDIQHEVTEWFEIHSDKVKVKLWGEKMQKLAEKLKKPGGEERLRMKIEKYLKKVPDQFSEGDDDKLEFRKQLPDDIIRKLKKMYLNPTEANINVYRMELFKYCSRFKMDNFKKVIMNWLKNLNIKKKDFLGRNVKKDDVFKYVTDKLEPLVLDRPKSDSEYKNVLKSNITDIIDELPLVLGNHNKEYYVNKVTDTLVTDIFNIESKVPSTYIQPTIKEVKEFVKDEITFFLEKAHVGISTKRMECLETELTDLLLDLTDIVDIDGYVMEDVTTILKDIGKLPEYKAKYFTNLLLKDFKEFFFRQSFFQEKDKTDFGHPDVYSVFQNTSDVMNINDGTNYDAYARILVQEIFEWLSKINIPNKDKYFTEVVVKDLASDVVDRYKYLELNPNTRGTDTEELEHLKYQIFKWTHKLVGDENTAVLEHAPELMKIINNIPKPSLPIQINDQSTPPQNADISTDTKTFNEKLIDEIYDWFHELPTDHYVSQDASLNQQFIKDLAEDIEKGLNKRDLGVIEKVVPEWTKKVFNTKLNSNDIEQLKLKIRSVSFIEDNVEKDHVQEKVLIRCYEDIVDEWLDTVPIELKKEGLSISNRNEFIHELAVKIYNIKTRLNRSPDTVIERTLQGDISDWMKKLPLNLQDDKQKYRDKYAAKLSKNIQACHANDSIEMNTKQTDEEFEANQLEGEIIDWLKKLPSYKNKSLKDKENQEEIIKELAAEINTAISGGHFDLDEFIIERIKMLDSKQNDDFIQDTAKQLKLYLEKYMLGEISQRHDTKDESLVANIEIWINNLALDVKDVYHFEKQKTDFIESMKRLRSSGSDNVVIKKEILTFMNTLPMNRSKRGDMKYMEEEAFKLIQNLTVVVPVEDILSKSLPKSNEIVSDAIKEWTRTLPLKSVYCPRELRSFIEDMSLVITSFLDPEHPEHSITEENDQRLRREIIKFLRRFPLQQERSTETHISRMAENLAKILKDIHLYRDDTKKDDANSVSVYGVSLNINTTDNDFSIRSIQESDINANLDTYAKQLVDQIGEWFDNLNVPNIHEEAFKEVVINDLAGDIIDRHKYLELNPQSGGTKEEELEHLKYQIFKWINKLVGEENLETIDHADDLMQRVQSIPVPMLVRPQDKSHTLTLPNLEQKNNSQSASPKVIPVIAQQVNELPIHGVPADGGSLREPPPPPQQQSTSSRMSSPGALGIPNNTKCCSREPPPPPPTPLHGTKEAIYEKYQKIFREKCNIIPIDKSTPENATLAELAKTGIYNGIVKTFFRLKSDPEIENDYGYFEFMLEEKIEEMLDILPQTEELINKRHAWKLEILASAIDMLDELHALTDRPSFRQRVRNKFNRNFARDLELEQCFLLQQGFLAEMADAYILETKYKEEDPIKAVVYKRRLMKKVDDLANHLAKEHNAGFRFFKKSQLIRIAMKALEQVPIPVDSILTEEAEEIQLADEVEKWYKELPTQPLINPTDGVLRKRMMDLLAKKLYDIEKHVNDQDPSKEAQMKHEISQFLEKRAKLHQDQDLNINFMVDELNHRLKNRWLQQPADYKHFEKKKPLSSTFAQVDNNDFLAPLMDAATSTGPLQSQAYHEAVGQAALRDQQSILQSSYVGPNQSHGPQPGHPMQSVGQVQTPPRASPDGAYGDLRQMGPSQGFVYHSIQGSGQGPMRISPHANNLAKSQHGPIKEYISHQEVPMHGMGPGQSPSTFSPYGSGLGPIQVGPSDGYVSQQSPHMHSIAPNATSPRNMHGNHVQTSQYRSDERYISQQGPLTQNMAQVAASPKNIYEPQTSPVGSKSSYVNQQSQPRSNISQGRSLQIGTPYGSNMNASQVGAPQGYMSLQGSRTNNSMHGVLRNSQFASSPRMQNINQSIRQGLPSQAGPQELYNQNLVVPTVYGPQGQLEFSPNYPTQGLSPMDILGYTGSEGPTPSHSAGTTAQVPGAPDEEMREDMKRDYLMRCRCLEAYRKRRRCFEYGDRCPRFRPYKCYY